MQLTASERVGIGKGEGAGAGESSSFGSLLLAAQDHYGTRGLATQSRVMVFAIGGGRASFIR